MDRMTDKEQKKEYGKAKPFSRAGRMRAASVAMGASKGRSKAAKKPPSKDKK